MNNPENPHPAIGKPLDRVEGHAKVTGQARYAAEYPLQKISYGVLVTSSVTKGHITAIDSRKAEGVTGVLAVISHLNAPRIPGYDQNPADALPIFSGREFKLFQGNAVHFNGQPVAMVVAETLEQAEWAASLVSIQYETEPHQTDPHENRAAAIVPDKPSDYTRGEPGAWEGAPVKVSQEYRTPIQVHNPIEPHAATAYWEGDERLFIFNKTQAVKTTQEQFAKYFHLEPGNVRVVAPFVGGAFGSASRMWPHELAAVLAARKVGRPVKVVCKRTQVFNMVGYRPYSIQQFSIGATREGIITAIRHDAFGSTARYEQFLERITEPTKSMYNCASLSTTYRLIPLDVSTPCPARGPGETSGSFAMESAVDELSYALGMDPLELRRKNFAATDPLNNLPWSSNYLLECYATGAERFGWHHRDPAPRSMKRGRMLVGMGMAAGIYKAERAPASAGIACYADGRVEIRSSVADTGPGSATILTQIAADALGVPVQQVSIQWADSLFPFAPPQYGSHTTASTGSAVHDAALALRDKFAALHEGGDTGGPLPFGAILRKQGLEKLEAEATSKPAEEKAFSGKSFSAHFVEVQADPDTGEVRVTRVVSVIDAGRIMNPKTGHSQVLGSVVWGIGLALMEEGLVDHRYGRYVNNNLAEYHVPVNRDIPDIDVHFIDRADLRLDPMGAKGLGEIGLIGLTAAIGNAVFHATGRRIRQLPITPDKLL